MLRIESLVVDDHILDKIESKHGLILEEVEESCLSERWHARRSKEGLCKLCQSDVCRALRPGGAGRSG